MKKITLRPIDEIARARAAECAKHGEWIPSETWARFHRACKVAGLDVTETYLAARAEIYAAEDVAR